MVAGFLGAVDNDIAIVGVAPGASLWAVRVGLEFLDGKDRFDRAVLAAAGRTPEAEI